MNMRKSAHYMRSTEYDKYIGFLQISIIKTVKYSQNGQTSIDFNIFA